MNTIPKGLALTFLVTGISCSEANQLGPIEAPSPPPQNDSAAESATSTVWQHKTFEEWKMACTPLPTNRQLGGRLPSNTQFPLTAQEFNKALDAAFLHFQSSPMAESSNWVGDALDETTFFDTTRVYVENKGVPFTPFANKLTVDPNTRFIVHGDFHGDIHSLITLVDHLNQREILDGFKITQPNTRFLFLGDYTDRGVYGAEVIYTLIRLKLANPEKVHLARGNHEDLSLTARYGFFAELVGKFGREYDLRKPLRLYDFLPVVIYVGCQGNFIQCNHGGMEPGFDPKTILASSPKSTYQQLGELKQKSYLEAHPDFLSSLPDDQRLQFTSMLRDYRPESPVIPVTLGFMWNDFSIVAEQPALSYNPGRAWVYGQATTQHLLKQASTENHRLRAVIRAHQHSSLLDPMMRRLVACRGVHRHWQERDNVTLLEKDPRQLETVLESQAKRNLPDGSVFTFNVAPDSAYGIGCKFDFDTYAELTTAPDFEQWTLQVHNLRSDKW